MAKNEDLSKKLKKIKDTDAFFMTITVLNKKCRAGKDLSTFILANKFPYEKIERAKKMIVKLIDKAKKENK